MLQPASGTLAALPPTNLTEVQRMNAQELLAVVEETWRQLAAAIDGLDNAAMVEPGIVASWSV